MFDPLYARQHYWENSLLTVKDLEVGDVVVVTRLKTETKEDEGRLTIGNRYIIHKKSSGGFPLTIDDNGNGWYIDGDQVERL